MSMLSVTDLFYGERESVQILKDEQREILEMIHRYNYFYTEPPPLSDTESTDVTIDDSKEEDLESNWKEVEESPRQSSARQSSVQDSSDENKDGNEEKFRISNASQPESEPDAKVMLKVPMCCPECEETVTIALKNVAGVADVVTFLLKEMVTVTGTAPPGDLLLACRDLKLFRKTRLWRDDSD